MSGTPRTGRRPPPVGAVALALFLMSAAAGVVAPAPARAETFPLCLALKRGPGLGAPRVELTLSASADGPFVRLVGQGRFSQAIAPPGSLVVYAVTGTAIPNEDGWWISLTGAGYDLASTVYHGVFAIQLSADPAKSTLSYTKQGLDGSAVSTLTGASEVVACPG